MQSSTALIFLFPALLIGLADCGRSPEAKKKIAQETADQMQAQLLSALTQAIAEKGPVGAIEVCRTLSPETEKKLSARGVTVRRVSDRTRNPSHRPDEWEGKVLAEWKETMAKGGDIQPRFEDGPAGLRFLKPIKIGNEACLQCHGDHQKMKRDVKDALAKLYPEDQAMGYALGDLRGAISVTVK